MFECFQTSFKSVFQTFFKQEANLWMCLGNVYGCKGWLRPVIHLISPEINCKILILCLGLFLVTTVEMTDHCAWLFEWSWTGTLLYLYTVSMLDTSLLQFVVHVLVSYKTWNIFLIDEWAKIPNSNVPNIFLLANSQNVQLNRFNTRMLYGESKIREVGGTGGEDGPWLLFILEGYFAKVAVTATLW